MVAISSKERNHARAVPADVDGQIAGCAKYPSDRDKIGELVDPMWSRHILLLHSNLFGFNHSRFAINQHFEVLFRSMNYTVKARNLLELSQLVNHLYSCFSYWPG